MASYRATVTRDGRFWLVRVDGVGSTQARHLRELDAMAKDLITVITGEPEPEIVVDYDIRLPAEAETRQIDPSALLAEVSKRVLPVSEALRRGSGQSRTCGAWMPVARARLRLGTWPRRTPPLGAVRLAAAVRPDEATARSIRPRRRRARRVTRPEPGRGVGSTIASHEPGQAVPPAAGAAASSRPQGQDRAIVGRRPRRRLLPVAPG